MPNRNGNGVPRVSAQPRSQPPFHNDRLRQRGSTKPRAASWSADQYDFAERMIAWWKDCSKKGNTPCASKTRRNRFVAIQLYRWLNSTDNEDPKMTEDDVKIGVEAYSQDDYQNRKCEGRYQSFGDWFRGCPDNVDKQLTRIGKKRGNDLAQEKAMAVVLFHGWGKIADMATTDRQVLYEYVEARHEVTSRNSSRNDLSREAADRRQHEQWLGHLLRVLQSFRRLEKPAMTNLLARASRCFLVHAVRVHSMKSTGDRNLRVAMACSLLDRYGEGQVTKPPPGRAKQ